MVRFEQQNIEIRMVVDSTHTVCTPQGEQTQVLKYVLCVEHPTVCHRGISEKRQMWLLALMSPITWR